MEEKMSENDTILEFEEAKANMAKLLEDPHYLQVVQKWKNLDENSFPSDLNYIVSKQLQFLFAYFDSLPKIISHYSSTEISALDSLLDEFRAFFDKIPNKTEQLIDEIDSMSKSIGHISNSSQQFFDSVKRSEESVKKMVKSYALLKKEQDSFMGDFSLLKESFCEATINLAMANAEAVNMAAKLPSALKTDIQNAMKDAQTGLSETRKKFEDGTAIMQAKFDETLKKFDSKTDLLAGDFKQQAESACSEAKLQFEGISLEGKKQISKTLDEVRSGIDIAMKSIVVGAKESVSGLADNCNKQITNQFEKVKTDLLSNSTTAIQGCLKSYGEEAEKLRQEKNALKAEQKKDENERIHCVKELGKKIDYFFISPWRYAMWTTGIIAGIVVVAIILGANKYVEIRTRDQASMIAENLHKKYLGPGASAKQLLRIVRKDGKVYVKITQDHKDFVGFKRANNESVFYMAADFRDETELYNREE
jgi:hypothetical protein